MSKPFTGLVGQMRDPSPWLSSEDIAGRGDVALVIESVNEHEGVKFSEGRAKDRAFTLKFKGAQKELVLNNTNRKTLYRVYGAKVTDWIGETVTLFIDPTVRLAGKQVDGIRFREGVTKLKGVQ